MEYLPTDTAVAFNETRISVPVALELVVIRELALSEGGLARLLSLSAVFVPHLFVVSFALLLSQLLAYPSIRTFLFLVW